MQQWKILTLGVTGDLAKTKVLPAVAEFADLNKENVQIDFIGYSRSQPNSQEIVKILDENSTDGKNSLRSISFFQGEYNNAQFFDSLYSTAVGDQRLIIYMAVPPSVFVEFLRTSCPHHDKNIEIVMEKPFGRDMAEAVEILNLLKECSLNEKVHFVDHYLFKPQFWLSPAQQLNLKFLKEKVISKVTIQALESVGVGNRGRYYEQAGAIKDMLPHIFSLFNQSTKILDKNFNLEKYENFQITDLRIARYDEYTKDTGVKDSKIDTYFYLEAKLESVQIIWESGKMLGQKLTLIEVDFEDGSRLNWQIAPEGKIEIFSTDQNLTLALDKKPSKDHTNMFKALLNYDYSLFVTHSEMLTGWWIYDKIQEKRNSENTQIEFYKSGQKLVQISTNSKIPKIETDLEKAKIKFENSLKELLTSVSLDYGSKPNAKKAQL
jgi:glucose-6-phosphate 1-dehydrogenase